MIIDIKKTIYISLIILLSAFGHSGFEEYIGTTISGSISLKG